MEETLKELAEEAKALAEKKSYLKEGLKELLDKLNEIEELTKIHSDFTVYAVLYSESLDKYKTREVRLEFSTEYNPTFDICVYDVIDIDSDYDDCEKEEVMDWDELPINILRKVVLALPDGFKNIADQLKNMNGEFGEAVDVLQKLVSSVKQ
jgi:vacuolar-type H+-ATPase subunit I/STV1